MQITLIGINHKTAPVAVREKLAFPPDALPSALKKLIASTGMDEAVILSTCNRVEIISLCRDESPVRDKIVDFLLAEKPEVSRRDIVEHLYCKENAEAVGHLFQVTGGLDSMVVGENQILAQVKQAYHLAWDAKCTGKVFNHLFNAALATGKRIRSETRVAESPTSVSSVAVEFASRIFYNFPDKTVLLVGSGETGQITLSNLVARGLHKIIVTNRTFDKARLLAGQFGGKAVEYGQLEDYLPKADIVITASGAPHAFIQPDQVVAALKIRRNIPIVFIDLGVPRNVNPAVNDIQDIYVYDLDDLSEVAAENMERRKEERQKALPIVEAEVENFFASLQQWDIDPVIRDLTAHAKEIQTAELERTLARMGNLTDDQKDEIRGMAHRLTQKILHPQVTGLKEVARNGYAFQVIDLMKRVFRAKTSEPSPSSPANPDDENPTRHPR